MPEEIRHAPFIAWFDFFKTSLRPKSKRMGIAEFEDRNEESRAMLFAYLKGTDPLRDVKLVRWPIVFGIPSACPCFDRFCGRSLLRYPMAPPLTLLSPQTAPYSVHLLDRTS
jgi:hypothetical protein